MKDRFGIDWSNKKGTFFWARPQLNRRMFFRHTASAVGGYFLLPSRPMEAIARAAAQPDWNGEERHLHSDGRRTQPLRYIRSEGRILDALLHGAHILRRHPLAARHYAEAGGADGQHCAAAVSEILGSRA